MEAHSHQKPWSPKAVGLFIYFYPHPRTCFLILEGGGRDEGESEKHRCERETLIGCLIGALIGDQTPNPGIFPGQGSNRDLWLMGWCANQLRRTSQGWGNIFDLWLMGWCANQLRRTSQGWDNIFKCWGEILLVENPISGKTVLWKWEREVKTFSDKQKLREFITTKYSLK